MSSSKLRWLFLGLTIPLLALPFGLSFPTAAQKATSSEFLEIAEESLKAQYDTLVSGDGNAAFRGKRFTHSYHDVVQASLPTHIALRLKLKERKQDFKSFRTKLSLDEINVNGDQAELKAIETTEFDMDPPGGPRLARTSDVHVFKFARVGGEWQLIQDSVVRPKLEAPPGGLPPTTVPLPPPLVDRPGVAAQRRAEKSPSFVNASFFRSAPASYDANAASQYAQAHATNYNPSYCRFGNDCTNFASQSVFAGGWPMVTGFYRNTNVWWFSCLVGNHICNSSYTWGAAWNFHEFLGISHRADTLSGWQDTIEGDLIFADWDTVGGGHLPDGRVDHVMIVTGKDTQGNTYISQHTNDRLNWPMTATLQLEPNARFYGYRMKSSF